MWTITMNKMIFIDHRSQEKSQIANIVPCSCFCQRVPVCSCMRTEGLISLRRGLPLTSSSSIVQFLCVCVGMHMCTAPAFLFPPPSTLNYSSSKGLCALVSLTYLEANRGVCVCVNVRADVRAFVTWVSVVSLLPRVRSSRLSGSPLPSLPLSLASLMFPAVCACCTSDCMFDPMGVSLRGALVGWVWIEGLGCPSGLDTCPAGTTQAPTSSAEVRRAVCTSNCTVIKEAVMLSRWLSVFPACFPERSDGRSGITVYGSNSKNPSIGKNKFSL